MDMEVFLVGRSGFLYRLDIAESWGISIGIITHRDLTIINIRCKKRELVSGKRLNV